MVDEPWEVMDLEYRIGGLDPVSPETECRFVVYKRGYKSLGLYALNKGKGRHSNVAEYYKLRHEDVLGGGVYDLTEQGLFLREGSKTFGTIPGEVAQRFGELLAGYFRNRGLEVKTVRVHMDAFFINEERRAIWESLGFEAEPLF